MVARAQGVGPKLAQRIVNELKDKAGGIALGAGGAAAPIPAGSHAPTRSRRSLNLGFRPCRSLAGGRQGAKRSSAPEATLDALVRAALKKAAR